MTTLHVTGMTCAHCTRAVTDAIHRLDAAATVTVTVDLEHGTVATDSSVAPAELAEAIRGEGYGV